MNLEFNDVFKNKMLAMDAAGYPFRNLGHLDPKMFGSSEGGKMLLLGLLMRCTAPATSLSRR
jgi:hypothetical protein